MGDDDVKEWLILLDEKPVTESSRKKNELLHDLSALCHRRWNVSLRVPRIQGKEVDLYALYSNVTSLGGWLKVSNDNRWGDVLDELGFSHRFFELEHAIKIIYMKYLAKYEQDRFGFDSIDINEVTSASSKARSKHYLASYCGMSSRRHLTYGGGSFGQPSTSSSHSYHRLQRSLESGLPNEVDYAINVAVVLSSPGPHTMQFAKCPQLLDLLLAHVGVFDYGLTCYRPLYEQQWRQLTGRQFLRFWYDSIDDDDSLRSTVLSMLGPPEGSLEQDGGWSLAGATSSGKLFNLCHDFGRKDVVAQRISQICCILRNLSFEDHNKAVMANSKTLLTFLITCIHSKWIPLQTQALDILSNVTTEIRLEQLDSDFLALLFKTLQNCLYSDDKFHLIRALETIGNLCLVDANEQIVSEFLEPSVLGRIVSLVTIKDIMLCVYLLECLYQISEMGPFTAQKMVRVPKIIDALVSLVTIEAVSFGQNGLMGMKVVEYGMPQSSGAAQLQHAEPAHPSHQSAIVTSGIPPGAQMMSQQQPMVVRTPVQQGQVGIAPARMVTLPVVTATSQQATPQPSLTASSTQLNRPPPQQSTSSIPIQQPEIVALSWLKNCCVADPQATITRSELYAMYAGFIQRHQAANLTVVPLNTFSILVRQAFPSSVAVSTDDHLNRSLGIKIEGIRFVPPNITTTTATPTVTAPILTTRLQQRPPAVQISTTQPMTPGGASTVSSSSDAQQFMGYSTPGTPDSSSLSGLGSFTSPAPTPPLANGPNQKSKGCGLPQACHQISQPSMTISSENLTISTSTTIEYSNKLTNGGTGTFISADKLAVSKGQKGDRSKQNPRGEVKPLMNGDVTGGGHQNRMHIETTLKSEELLAKLDMNGINVYRKAELVNALAKKQQQQRNSTGSVGLDQNVYNDHRNIEQVFEWTPSPTSDEPPENIGERSNDGSLISQQSEDLPLSVFLTKSPSTATPVQVPHNNGIRSPAKQTPITQPELELSSNDSRIAMIVNGVVKATAEANGHRTLSKTPSPTPDPQSFLKNMDQCQANIQALLDTAQARIQSKGATAPVTPSSSSGVAVSSDAPNSSQSSQNVVDTLPDTHPVVALATPTIVNGSVVSTTTTISSQHSSASTSSISSDHQADSSYPPVVTFQVEEQILSMEVDTTRVPDSIASVVDSISKILSSNEDDVADVRSQAITNDRLLTNGPTDFAQLAGTGTAAPPPPDVKPMTTKKPSRSRKKNPVIDSEISSEEVTDTTVQTTKPKRQTKKTKAPAAATPAIVNEGASTSSQESLTPTPSVEMVPTAKPKGSRKKPPSEGAPTTEPKRKRVRPAPAKTKATAEGARPTPVSSPAQLSSGSLSASTSQDGVGIQLPSAVPTLLTNAPLSIFMCEWATCNSFFATANEVFMHVTKVHIPTNVLSFCHWPHCDRTPRSYWSLVTHIQDNHCTTQILTNAAQRRNDLAQTGVSAIDPPKTPPPHPGYPKDAPLSAIRRHAFNMMPKDITDETEGPVTRSLRLTACLILRNLVHYDADARRLVKQYESHLARIAFSKLEAATALAQCLGELATPFQSSMSASPMPTPAESSLSVAGPSASAARFPLALTTTPMGR